jgi:hypothetical protein
MRAIGSAVGGRRLGITIRAGSAKAEPSAERVGDRSNRESPQEAEATDAASILRGAEAARIELAFDD